jgi:hypothetical protein
MRIKPILVVVNNPVIKWFMRIVIGAAVVFLLLGVAAIFFKSSQPPDIKEAPWAIQTSTRIFYARLLFDVDGDPAITDYWRYDGKKYHHVEGTLVFETEEWGKVLILRR